MSLEAPTGTATYVEPARSYASAYLFALLLLAGFIVDLVIGGGVAHLPGWIIAAVLVIGIDVLVVHAARVTKSLTLTGAELRVGDEAVGRAEITGVTRGVDPELPVLGWPAGMPRGVRGVIIRLFDDQDVVIPTRHPDRLEAALGVGAAAPRSAATIRAATADDWLLIAEIDERAETVFRIAGHELPKIDFDEDALAAAAAIFVVGEPPVGFVQVEVVDGVAHIAGLAVIPRHLRQGLGTRLVERVYDWAQQQGYPAITLTAYADIPWNGPFFISCGFALTSELTPELADLREREQKHGLDDVGRRIVMRREVGPDS